MIIYRVTNLINGKQYIGMDTNNNPDYLGSGFQIKQAIKKYGKENFSKEILEECTTLSELREREVFWIKFFNAVQNENYYNLLEEITPLQKGRKRSEETRKKISKVKQEYYKEHPGPNKGKKFSADVRAKISTSKKGQKLSEETCKKLSEVRKGRPCTWGSTISKSKTGTPNSKTWKPVDQYDLQGNFLKRYPGVAVAKKETGINTIYSNLCGDSKTAGGFIWKYPN